MSKTYTRIDINGKEDLPKTNGRYDCVFNDNSFGSALYDKSQDYATQSDIWWVNKIKFYYEPIADELPDLQSSEPVKSVDKAPIDQKELKCWNCERPIVFIPNGLPAYRCSCGAVSPESKPIEPQKQEEAGYSEEDRKDFCLWYYAQSQPLDANKVFAWFIGLEPNQQPASQLSSQGEITEINFDGNCKAELQVVNGKIKVLNAISGWGDKIKESEIVVQTTTRKG